MRGRKRHLKKRFKAQRLQAAQGCWLFLLCRGGLVAGLDEDFRYDSFPRGAHIVSFLYDDMESETVAGAHR